MLGGNVQNGTHSSHFIGAIAERCQVDTRHPRSVKSQKPPLAFLCWSDAIGCICKRPLLPLGPTFTLSANGHTVQYISPARPPGGHFHPQHPPDRTSWPLIDLKIAKVINLTHPLRDFIEKLKCTDEHWKEVASIPHVTSFSLAITSIHVVPKWSHRSIYFTKPAAIWTSFRLGVHSCD